MLTDFVDTVAQDSHLRVDKDLGDGFFKLRESEAQRRQAKQDIRCSEDIVVEMLRNSRDANAENIYLATNTQENNRYFIVIDDGDGVPESHSSMIFKPYVTSKLNTMTTDMWGVHGRGMALYSIKENSREARVLNSGKGRGCSIYVRTRTDELKEKTDQSTFPSFKVNENKELVVRGPKNILRITSEFAIENRKQVNVFIGSPAEIAATIYKNHKANNSVFGNPTNDTKLVDLLSYSSDTKEFTEYAASIGLIISERTSRRIMDGEVNPQCTILDKITFDKNNKIITIKNPITRFNKIKISKKDQVVLQEAVKDAFSQVGEKYYLNTDIEPKMTIRRGKANISFEILPID